MPTSAPSRTKPAPPPSKFSPMGDEDDLDAKGEINRILAAKNYFEVLKVKIADTNVDEVRSRFKKLSLKIHPDKCPEELKARAQDAFAELRKASDLLCDPDALRELQDGHARVLRGEKPEDPAAARNKKRCRAPNAIPGLHEDILKDVKKVTRELDSDEKRAQRLRDAVDNRAKKKEDAINKAFDDKEEEEELVAQKAGWMNFQKKACRTPALGWTWTAS
eukprot:gene6571-1172_t